MGFVDILFLSSAFDNSATASLFNFFGALLQVLAHRGSGKNEILFVKILTKSFAANALFLCFCVGE